MAHTMSISLILLHHIMELEEEYINIPGTLLTGLIKEEEYTYITQKLPILLTLLHHTMEYMDCHCTTHKIAESSVIRQIIMEIMESIFIGQ